MHAVFAHVDSSGLHSSLLLLHFHDEKAVNAKGRGRNHKMGRDEFHALINGKYGT
jgi:hypothetical protein